MCQPGAAGSREVRDAILTGAEAAPCRHLGFCARTSAPELRRLRLSPCTLALCGLVEVVEAMRAECPSQGVAR